MIRRTWLWEAIACILLVFCSKMCNFWVFLTTYSRFCETYFASYSWNILMEKAHKPSILKIWQTYLERILNVFWTYFERIHQPYFDAYSCNLDRFRPSRQPPILASGSTRRTIGSGDGCITSPTPEMLHLARKTMAIVGSTAYLLGSTTLVYCTMHVPGEARTY